MYRIKTVAELTGISTTSLRAWERRYDVVQPHRTDSGYRVYSEDDVALLTQVKRLVDNGFAVSEAIQMVRRGAQDPAPADVDPDRLSALCRELRQRLLEMDAAGAQAVLDRLTPLPSDRMVDEVFVPLLHSVGNGWSAGDVTICQEHFASGVARERMARMLADLTRSDAEGPEAVLFGVPGEAHELGLLAVAVHLALRGWRVVYLGLEVPEDELSTVLRLRRPRLVCTSLTTERPVDELRELLDRLRELAPAVTTVAIGGQAVPTKLAGRGRAGASFTPRLHHLLRIPAIADAA